MGADTVTTVRVEGSGTVHHAGTSIDRTGAPLPHPACNTGIAGWDPGRLRPSKAPVNCLRCIRLAKKGQRPAHVGPAALTLF